MTKQEKIKWLIEAGLAERTADGTLRLTDEGMYISGQYNDQPQQDEQNGQKAD